MTVKRLSTAMQSSAEAGAGNSEDDRVFDAWVEALDEADAPDAGIEAALAQADATPLSPEFIKAAVTRATATSTGMRSVLRSRALAAAAVVVGTLMLTAATVVLLWPERHHSRLTLDYGEAIAVTQRGDQVADHAPAFKVLWARIEQGIQALWVVCKDPNSEATLRTEAEEALEALRLLLDTEDRRAPVKVSEQIDAIVGDLTSGSLDSNRRRESVIRLSSLLRQGILAIKFPASSSQESLLFANKAITLIRFQLAPR